MNIRHLNIGILHSLIGKNDGVSIVIDQTVNAMINDMDVRLGNIFFLAAHTSPRFNATTNEIFWHKNAIHKLILENYTGEPPEELDELIHSNAMYAKGIIEDFIRDNNIDLLIAHNTTHPYNFITAVGLGYYIEELRSRGIIWPKLLVWWHDSYFERDRFQSPNHVIKKYLKYLPGTYVDGFAFINHSQISLCRQYLEEQNAPNIDRFLRERAVFVPNTSDIYWDWKNKKWDGDEVVFPEQDNYNESLFHDLGLMEELEDRNISMEDTVILLQHTRIVPRKKIELAIDFAFRLEKKFAGEGMRKAVVLLVSGHSGDEQTEYKRSLIHHHVEQKKKNPDANVILLFGENIILSHRDIIVDKKYYKFNEIPMVVAASGGVGTYFSEVEGFGNNLLEMVSSALPAVINKYEVYKSEIEPLGFRFPSIENLELTDQVVDETFELLTDCKNRNEMVQHNLKVLDERLGHRILAGKLIPLITNMFTKSLRF